MLDRVIADKAKVLGSEGYDIQVSLSISALLQAACGDIVGADQQSQSPEDAREAARGDASINHLHAPDAR